MKIHLLSFLFLVSLLAQSSTKDKASVQKYLKEIHLVAVNKSLNKDRKIKVLNQLIQQGISQRIKLEALIKKESKYNSEELLRSFNFILQSMGLLKTDLQNGELKSEELKYIEKNVPMLLKKISIN